MVNLHPKDPSKVPFANDFMFSTVLTSNLSLAQALIERILDRKIHKIRLSQKEKTIDLIYDSHGVRFDVWFQDANNNVYVVEMQTYREKHLLQRIDYAHAIIDADYLRKEAYYDKLPARYVVYICMHDPFGAGLPVYRFKTMNLEGISIKKNVLN